jgi:hypothetical protein
VFVTQCAEGAARLFVNEVIRTVVGGDPTGHGPAPAEMPGTKSHFIAEAEPAAATEAFRVTVVDVV